MTLTAERRSAEESLAADQSPTGPPLFGPGTRPVRTSSFSALLHTRTMAVTLLITAAALAVAGWNMVSGSAMLGITEVIQAFLGSADEGTTRVVLEWRAPRVLFTLLGGAALALAGAVFQSQTRNPLGSPDIIGFSTGAYTGALLMAAVGFTGLWATPIAAILGGLATGAAVYLLAWKRGVSGLRIIIVGIGVSIFLSSFNTYLLTVLSLETAMSVATWGAGSVNDITWNHVYPLLAVTAVALPVMLAHARQMRLMEMGDDAASGLGIRLERVRLIQFTGGILLVAVVTAAAGPIAFIALVAPQLALRLTAASSVQLLPAAAMGALLLTASDAIARAETMPVSLPVGVVTLVLGGAYLVWLLVVMGRSKRGNR
ncbi:FecCD family ABC transporter permease [Nesterenkonia ebinurensis]|uniref:FecCD family ABC transporter permease n=1 Tax=Nesterenkonia ebinurensis TaxID=2608252 RepID=UPI001CC3546D|nr:iron chelate uptake ABC transporter family permease subunit [Nesterenkonia ebinurensis]